MVEYIKYDYYSGTYKGTVPSNKFEQLLIKASSYIKERTFSRININNVPEEVKYATCLIIDKIYEYDNKIRQVGIKKSESVGKVSITYTDKEDLKKELKEELNEILNTYLADVVSEKGISLLYRGC